MNQDILQTPHFRQNAEQLADTVRFLAQRGWSPATSSNFSVRLDSQLFAISKSGKDKYAFSADDVMVVDPEGNPVAPEGARPSAETLLHTQLYENPAIGSVLHTHSVNATLLSMWHSEALEIEGYELLKGLAGNATHELREVVPIFPNSQDMGWLSAQVRDFMARSPHIHGYLISGHGLYTWGASLAEARRHVETFEFLFECLIKSEERK